MSLEQIKQLLKIHKIAPNKLLGQNFMVDPSLYAKLSEYGSIRQSDEILDAGAGFGFLTRFLSAKSKKVIAVEKDPIISKILRTQVVDLNNVLVIQGDFLRVKLPNFNKIIAVPPYYLSSKLLIWIFKQKIDCAAMIVQAEFAERMIAPVGSEKYSWLTVLTNHQANVQLLDHVAKNKFFPQPGVDSKILYVAPYESKPFFIGDQDFFIRLIKGLFTERNKKLSSALVPFLRNSFKIAKQEAVKIALNQPLRDKRVRDILPKDFGAIANDLLPK